ncbi:MAG: hypothetical protein D6685_18950 [Bacteroidetes bacterium]|nr:MAG: hypothetical protein D6685_18950 [Bacteroidota bacterium]
MRASASIVIERPIREVFTHVSDIGSLDQWMPRMQEPRALTEAPEGLGAIFTALYVRGHRPLPVTCQVTIFDPPHRFAFKVVDGPLEFQGHAAFIGLGGTTQVHLVVETRAGQAPARWVEAWCGPLLRARLRRQLQQSLAALRHSLVPPAPARTYSLHPQPLAA